MNGAYKWLSDRDGYVVPAVMSVVGLLSAFGTEFSAEQTVAISTAVGGVLALILGRPVTPAE